ncbi:MAG: FHA domain-containing protein, partial [Thermoanaerobaculia bacterium]
MLGYMATLRVKDSPDARLRNARFELASLPFTIGRARDCSLALSDDGASRQHVAIHGAAEGHWILDLESVNGTFVNGA